MQIDPAILICIAVHTGALIFYSGIVVAQLRNHDKRIDANEAETRRNTVDVAQLKMKEGMS